MAFDGTSWAILGNFGNNDVPKQYGYRTSDSLATVLGANYFDDKAADVTPGDTIDAHVGENPSGTLAASPFASVNTTKVVTVTHANHKLATGNKVTFAAATTFGGIPAAELNAKHTITVTTPSAYTITVTTAATSTTTGGGTPTFTSVGGGTKHILQVDGVTEAAAGTKDDVIVHTLGGGTVGDDVILTAILPDASSAGSVFVVSPIAGVITAFRTILGKVITTGDAVVALKIATVAVTGGSVTIANAGSAIGDEDTATPTAANIVAAGSVIEINTDGGSTVVAPVLCEVTISPATL